MQLLTAFMYLLGSWFLRPLMWGMSFKTIPETPLDDPVLDPATPLCYVLPTRSWIDWFALLRVCKCRGLPRPGRTGRHLPSVQRAGALYLPALLETRRRTTSLSALMRRIAAAQDYDLQLVPVSIFWGRDPGQQTSLFRLIFADNPQAGAVRKFVIMLVNGRNVLVHFGKPLSYRGYEHDAGGAAAAQRKLGRVLHVHFLHTRTAVVGPTLLRRAVVVDGVLAAPAVRDAIEHEAARKRQPVERVRERARGIAFELAADYSAPVVRVMAHVLPLIFRRVFKGIEVRGIERVREMAQSHALIYLPCHRSHADYMLGSYVLYRHGLVPPHVAAGINLNFWPIGTLLRHCGAFYIRRKLAGDALYSAVLRTYLDGLIRRGYAIEFFPEGGRSRTGRLLQPQTGLLSMAMESALRQTSRPVAFVPVYIGYDKVWEVNSYSRELRGRAKQKESAEALLKAGQILGKSYGRAYVSFGEPEVATEVADRLMPTWRQKLMGRGDARPSGFATLVRRFAVEHMRRVNGVAAVSPVSLCACALLATPRNLVAEEELVTQLEHLLALLEDWPYRSELYIPPGGARALLAWAQPIARIRRVPHAWGDLLVATGRDAVLMTYARNNVQHLFALPSLVACLFRTRVVLGDDAVVMACRVLYPFLQAELFLPWAPEDCEAAVRKSIDRLLDRHLLRRLEDGRLHRPDGTGPELAALTALAGILAETLERYVTLLLVMADEQGRGGRLERRRIEEECRVLAERLALMTGREAPEYFDKALFRGCLDTMVAIGVARQTESGFQVDERLTRMAGRGVELLNEETRQTLLQLIALRRHVPPATSSTKPAAKSV